MFVAKFLSTHIYAGSCFEDSIITNIIVQNEFNLKSRFGK